VGRTPLERPMRPDDPACLSPDQRCHAITRLLAAGIRRLLGSLAGTPPGPDSAPAVSQNFPQNSLEVPGNPRLTVQGG